ncbi:MAG: hypothetical protein ACOVKO_10270 [Elstera sp.]
MMKYAALLVALAFPVLAQAPSGSGGVPRSAVPAPVTPPPVPTPSPAAKPGTIVPSPGLLPLADTRARLEAALGRPVDKAQWQSITAAWKQAMAEARIAQNGYADRLAAITQLYRGRISELLPPLEQVGSFDGPSLFPKWEKERGLPLTREEKRAIEDADKARRAQVQPLGEHLVERYAAALALPPERIKAALRSAVPAASAPPSVAPPAKN